MRYCKKYTKVLVTSVSKFLYLPLVFFTMVACNNSNHTKESKMPTYAELEKASWLIGDWENKSAEEIVIEMWEKENDSTFHGIGYFVVGKDTVSSESISLIQMGKDLFYIPTVKEQNEGEPVSFKLTSSSVNQLVFENPGHDFPQKISYTKISEDSLMAVISGIVNGKENSQKFAMKRSR